mmetsp:Transcript_29221/g.77202  ORF Transcript_29221/g.77202 Transcript_29221/m.77202 type:complete len:235 (-) Transcript_29221:2063-2767(-)
MAFGIVQNLYVMPQMRNFLHDRPLLMGMRFLAPHQLIRRGHNQAQLFFGPSCLLFPQLFAHNKKLHKRSKVWSVEILLLCSCVVPYWRLSLLATFHSNKCTMFQAARPSMLQLTFELSQLFHLPLSQDQFRIQRITKLDKFCSQCRNPVQSCFTFATRFLQSHSARFILSGFNCKLLSSDLDVLLLPLAFGKLRGTSNQLRRRITPNVPQLGLSVGALLTSALGLPNQIFTFSR